MTNQNHVGQAVMSVAHLAGLDRSMLLQRSAAISDKEPDDMVNLKVEEAQQNVLNDLIHALMNRTPMSAGGGIVDHRPMDQDEVAVVVIRRSTHPDVPVDGARSVQIEAVLWREP